MFVLKINKIRVNCTLILTFNDAVDEEDDEQTVAIDRKRARKESALALKRLEKNIPGSTKKRPRVLVEVKICNVSVGFYKNSKHFVIIL